MSDCFIERDNSGVEHSIGSGEKRGDVLSVVREFVEPMREGVRCGSNGSVPSDRPVSTVRDCFSGLNRSERDFDVSNGFGSNVVIGRRELSTEDIVQVDRSPQDDVFPLGIGKFGTIR
jgi:hypothetical protein